MKSFPDAMGIRVDGARVAVVAARFNAEVVEPLVDKALATLDAAGVSDDHRPVFRVPGAYELPLAAKWLAEQGRCDGIVALGAVIRGETPHFDFVCNEAARGLNDVALTHGLPVGFGVITADSDAQAMARAGGAVGNKGEEAALAVIEMVDLSRRLHRCLPQ
ncbi:MAG: 6,7-dimethyl-8-ribityllumazine synthase [Pseudomonadota bacterium]